MRAKCGVWDACPLQRNGIWTHAYRQSGKSHREGSKAMRGVGEPGTCTLGSSGRNRIRLRGIPGIGAGARESVPDIWQLHSGACPPPTPVVGHHPSIPSLSGPRLTWVLIPSVDPKLEDYGGRRGAGGERREGSVQEPGLAGRVSCSWQDLHASPLTHPMQAGGPAACSLSRASCLLPAPCQSCSGTRSQPCPQLHLPPS